MNMQHSIKDLAKELADEPAETLVLPEETLGSLLHRARLAKRLQVDDVAVRLRFKPGVIQAMEDNNFQSLGAPVFVRMYLLRYTQLLGLPEHDILARYKALGVDEPPPLRVNPSIKPQVRASDLRWLGYPLLFIALGWLTWTGSQQFSIDPLLEKLGWAEPSTPDTGVLTTQATPSPTETTLANTDNNLSALGEELTSPMIATDTVLDFTSAPEESDTSNASNTPNSETNTESEANPDLATNPDSNSATTLTVGALLLPSDSSTEQSELGDSDFAATELSSASSPDATINDSTNSELANPATLPVTESIALNEHELLLEFSDDCWVEVKDSSGERLIYGIAKANEIRTVKGSLPFSIKFGNAHAVRLKLDGQSVDKALYIPSRGSVSRFSLENADIAPNQG